MKHSCILIKTCVFVFFLLVLFSNSAFSQIIEEFPTDSGEYIETLEDFLEKRISEAQQPTYEKFHEYWLSGKFSEDKMDSIVVVSNLLLKNRGKREPHFTTMMDFFLEMDSTRFDSIHFHTWMRGFRHVINLKKSKLPKTIDYFKFTLGFAKENALYLSNTRNWFAESNNFRFTYDTTLKIVYDETTLKCKFREDSIQIFHTNGTFYPFSKKWMGTNGKVTWERAGYNADDIYAELSDYDINMRKMSYTADSVEFTNKLYFDEPVLGKLEDQLVHIIKPQNAIYPVFTSYKQIFEIENIYENMDFIGGFEMKGAQFIGSGGKQSDALIKVHKDGKVFMTAVSQTFILQKEKAVSRKAEITIHLGNDSIYHTGLQFNYYVDNQEIELTSNDNILSKSVYYDTYHQLSMKIDRLLWNTQTNKIYLTYARNSSIGNAEFTSMNYFTLNKWLQLEMRDEVHPLIAIRNYHNTVDSRRFDAKEYAKYVEKPVHQVKQRLMFLAQDGFIFYDLDNDTVTINDKLFDYISSRIEKIDYDVIKLNSTTQAPRHNGILDLDSMSLTINGVPRIQVSDSQNVIIYPKGQQIVMKKNRSFHFAGAVQAGLFSYYGDDFEFSYKDFKIALEKIDSLHMQFQTEDLNMYGRAVLARVNNTIEDLSGDIFIDSASNKSGKEHYPKYPVFKSRQKSYVYYNELFDGPYKKENFYFELYPFEMDSLDNFNPENLKFEGNFYSANIFPPFEETLMLKEDNSLGFRRQTPEAGFPLYEGKGKYYNTIDMSNQGLRGEGKLTYLTSSATSDDILFFPDSTSIHANEYNVAEQTTGIEYPRITSNNVRIKWYPHEDFMNIEQTDGPFTMYNDSTQMSGKLTMKPTGISGTGKMDLSKAVLRSNHFTYEARSFDADTANFKLRTLDQSEFAFLTDTVDAHIDFDYQRGRFETIDNYSVSEFPKNLYVSYLDRFAWKMDENELEIESSPEPKTTYGRVSELESLKDEDLPGALYMSTHKGQDSLRFISEKMNYKLNDNTMHADKVKFIAVANARILPDEGKVTIQEKAKVKPLENAVIFADSVNKFHRFFNAEVQIKSRYDFTGQGDFEYVDKEDQSQIIHFDQIGVDTSVHTYANGTISREDSFTLSPDFGYAGDVYIKSKRKLMRYKGGAKLMYDCPRISPRYAQFEAILDPDDIYIPIAQRTTDINGRNLYSGPFITIDTTHIYTTFLTPRKDASDEHILGAQGYLHKNDQTNDYIIASRAKINDPDTTGSMLRLDKKNCWSRAEGKMNLGVDFGEYKIDPVGKLTHNLPKNDVKLDLTLPVDFLFSKPALDTMIKDIKERKDLRSINLGSSQYEKNLNELAGTKKASEYLSQARLFGDEADIPKELKKTILFSDIDFQWNTSTDSYIAKDNIGVAMINGKPVNKYVDGFVEIAKKRYGDKIYIYLKLDDDRFYYFYYFRTIMRTWSNNPDFIQAIKDIPRRKRRIKDGWLFGPTKFRYILSTETSFARFLKHKREVEQSLYNMKHPEENQEENQKKPQEEGNNLNNNQEAASTPAPSKSKENNSNQKGNPNKESGEG